MFNSASVCDDININSEFQPRGGKIKYDEYTGRPINYSQNLWQVHDGAMARPEERFHNETSPMVEAIIETSSGPMEEAPIPKGLVDFVTNFVYRFGITPTKYSGVDDVLYNLMPFLDYTEPYFLFVDMPVQIEGHNLCYTYRYKSSGQVLNPEKIETFKVKEDFNFDGYYKSIQFLEHPSAKEVLAGGFVRKPGSNESVTKEDLLDQLVTLLWGPPTHMRAHVEDWLWRFYENVEHDEVNSDDETLRSLEVLKQRDDLFWFATAVGAFLWIRSPHSLPFLIEYHPIYGSILRRNPESGAIELRGASGGEAIVYQYDVYTREHLIVEEGKPPGTCENCQQSQHCTKFINATALFHPVCSCGETVQVEHTGEHLYVHGYSHKCDAYKSEHPAFEAFVCQRCLQTAIKDPHNQSRKCERFNCPATSCKHHAGKDAYIGHLTNQRRFMLTQMQQ